MTIDDKIRGLLVKWKCDCDNCNQFRIEKCGIDKLITAIKSLLLESLPKEKDVVIPLLKNSKNLTMAKIDNYVGYGYNQCLTEIKERLERCLG